MLSYVFMKILEMRPAAYDRRMKQADRGRVHRLKADVARSVPSGSRVLEIGCGTGQLAAMLARRDCMVLGLDPNPGMIRECRNRIQREKLEERFSVRPMGVEGMDRLPPEDFDAVVATLVFSELNADERRFALKHAARVLRPGGILLVADEVEPRKRFPRAVHRLARIPLILITYLLAGATTRPLRDLAGELREAGFQMQRETRSRGDAFTLVWAVKVREV